MGMGTPGELYEVTGKTGEEGRGPLPSDGGVERSRIKEKLTSLVTKHLPLMMRGPPWRSILACTTSLDPREVEFLKLLLEIGLAFIAWPSKDDCIVSVF